MLKEPFEPRFAPGVRTRGEARRDGDRNGLRRLRAYRPSRCCSRSLALGDTVTPRVLLPFDDDNDDERRRSGVPSNAITEKRRRRENASSLSLYSFLLSVARARARARPRRTRRGIETETTRSLLSVSYSSRRASTRLRRAGPVYNPSPPPRGCERELRGLGHAVGSRDPDLLSSCADRTRGGGRAPLREITAGTPLCDPRAAARNRVNASPVVLLVSLISNDAQGRRETAGPSTSFSLVADRFIRDSRGCRGRVSRALVTGERPTIARTRAPGTAARKQSLVT